MGDLVGPLERRVLSEEVAQELAALIFSGKLQPGTKLPSEHTLADQFNVSRNVVREGLRRLIGQGLVVVRPGDGVYVQIPDPSTVTDAFDRYLQLNRNERWLNELYEVRRLLEVGIAGIAAEHATEEDIQALDQALETMRASTDDPKAWAEADWEFHASLARASHNSLLLMILKPIHQQALRAFEEGWHYPRAYESGLRHHAEVLKCIRARDAEGAREAMRVHLEVSYQEVSSALQRRTGARESDTISSP